MSLLTISKEMSPFVTIKLQLWPQPPYNSRPYWCCIDTLLFYSGYKGGRMNVLWEKRIPEAKFSTWSAKVERDKSFGWCLILTLTHEKAKEVLSHLPFTNEFGGLHSLDRGPFGLIMYSKAPDQK